MVMNKIRQLASVLFAAAKPKERRSSKWPSVRKSWLLEHPNCAACGTAEFVEVHHLIPVSFDPTKELDRSNFLTLCETPGRDCHLRYGHCFSWKARNRFAVADANDALAMLKHIERRTDG